jgi:catechol 2,3-dioxygenase-like lactoylglutathione lyase family enzyme
MSDSQVNLRYMVSDVQESVDWYVAHLGFQPVGPASPAFAAVERGPLRLLLSGKAASAGRPMPDGRQPEPGGWNRFQFVVEDIGAEVERLRGEGVKFRNDVVTGPGGSQILAEDPSGNLVEVFQPAFQLAR